MDYRNLKKCKAGGRCWTQRYAAERFPCEHGHFDCARVERGECSDEHTATYFHRGDVRTDPEANGEGDLVRSEAYAESAEGATDLWDKGFRPMEAASLQSGMTVAYRATDVFQLESVGPVLYTRIAAVHLNRDEWTVDVVHDSAIDTTTEADWEDEVWAKA